MADTPTGAIYFAAEVFYSVSKGPNGSYNAVPINGELNTAARTAYRSFISSYMELAKSVVTQNGPEARERGYTLMQPGEARPADLYSEVVTKDGISHDEFEARKRQGEILMSNYLRIEMRVVTSPGFKSFGDESYTTAAISTTVFVESGHLIPVQSNFGLIYLIAGTPFARMDSGTACYYDRVWSSGKWSFPPTITAEHIIATIEGQIPDPKPVVTKTAAYANKRSLDVLTAAAEMPKTIASALSGMKLVAKIITDFRKGQFNLTKATAYRDKVINKRYKSKLDFINNQLKNPRASNKRKAELRERYNRIELKKRTTLAESAKEFADALAGLWLNYRYNLMPNVYLLQDIERALARVDHEFITARSKAVHEVIFTGPGWSFSENITTRCVIKRRFGDKSRFTAGGPQISADILTTTWELLPLSFVVDWFVRIGDWLAAWSFKNDWDEEGSSLSVKTQISRTIDLFPDSSYTIEPKVRVQGFYYKRLEINPTNYIGLCWQPNLDLARKTDALALIWRPVRSVLNNKR